MHVSIPGFEEYVEKVVAAKVEKALASRSADDPWFGSKAAADHMGVSVQRVHDLVSAGLLPRHGERGERLHFRRSELDHYMETRGRR